MTGADRIDTGVGPVHDLVGVGFGPAGIALAVAMDDHAEQFPGEPRPDAVFLERAGDSAWQPNMMFPGTDIQHHFMRDFATPRDPRSRFTFANYLVRNDQFFRFTLMGGYVTRRHWSDYVEWTAREVSVPASYHREVIEATPVRVGDRIVAVRVISRDPRDDSRHEQLARAMIVSTGHQPHVAEVFRPHLGARVFHAAEFLPRMAVLPPDVRSFAVIGAGQNAGEIVMHLHATYPDARIHALTRNAGFRMYELGHFSNEAYFPEEAEYFYALDREQRARVFAGLHATNYAAVDPDLSTALYRAAFEDRLTGRNRLRMHKRTEVTTCTPTGAGVRLDLVEVNTGATDNLDVDVVVVCTGFTEPRLPALLEPFAPHLRTDPAGDPVISRSFRLDTTPDCAVAIYLNGLTEWRHGISNATSFSLMAIKAETIRADLHAWLATNPYPQPDALREDSDARLHLSV